MAMEEEEKEEKKNIVVRRREKKMCYEKLFSKHISCVPESLFQKNHY